MPRDFKQRPARKGAPRRAPRKNTSPPRRWIWFGAGLCVGAVATASLFLLEPSPVSLVTGPGKAGAKAAPGDDGGPPRFEFYTLLPEKEIAIPETEIAPAPPPPAAIGSQSASAAPAPASEDRDRYLLQVGSFRKLADADRLKARIAFMGLQSGIQTVSIDGAETWHRVRVGPFTGRREVSEARQRLKENKMESLLLKLK